MLPRDVLPPLVTLNVEVNPPIEAAADRLIVSRPLTASQDLWLDLHIQTAIETEA